MKELISRVKEKLINYLLPGGFYFKTKGYCVCCDEEVVFEAGNSWLRDNLCCSNCQSIPRERALMHVIESHFPSWRELRIHESSPGNRGASVKLKAQCKEYIGSQYYPGEPIGKMVGDFRNEDLENMTFPDDYFDLIITQDVMEHLYDPEKAFSEIARTLKKGGAHIFTVPLLNKHKPTEVWATKGANGKPVFLHNAEYHGNPIDPEGSPVTMHWGFDIVDYIEKSSGMKTTIESILDINLGIWAELNEVLISRKE